MHRHVVKWTDGSPLTVPIMATSAAQDLSSSGTRRVTATIAWTLAIIGPVGILVAGSWAGDPWVAYIPGVIAICCAAAACTSVAGRRRLSRQRRWWRIVVIPSLILAASVGLIAANLPVNLRFGLSQKAFASLIRAVGEPNAATDRQGFPGPCPTRAGPYIINSCETVPTGYIFYDDLGSGGFDNAGFAYLPSGVPANVDSGSFESPQFTHIHGSWYSFTANW